MLLVLGSQMDLQVFLQEHVSGKKQHFKADISYISLAENRLMDVTQLALTWVGWPNSEQCVSTCVQI